MTRPGSGERDTLAVPPNMTDTMPATPTAIAASEHFGPEPPAREPRATVLSVVITIWLAALAAGAVTLWYCHQSPCQSTATHAAASAKNDSR